MLDRPRGVCYLGEHMVVDGLCFLVLFGLLGKAWLVSAFASLFLPSSQYLLEQSTKHTNYFHDFVC